MALSTKIIQQKIKSTRNIKKITKTMEMVSVSKMKKSVAKATSSRLYAMYALNLLINLSKNKDLEHTLMKAGKGEKELIVIVAGNKGLCGGYHTYLNKALVSYLSTNKHGTLRAVTIGKYGEKIAKRNNIEKVASFIEFSENSEIAQTQDLSKFLIKEYSSSEYKSVKILYTEFINSTSYKPVLRELFPINIESLKNLIESIEEETSVSLDTNLSEYLFEPNLTQILTSVLPGLVDSVIYQSLAEAFASEHSARMIAMKNAGDNATSILDSLILSYNHARQEGITKELSEIVAGAESLSVA